MIFTTRRGRLLLTTALFALWCTAAQELRAQQPDTAAARQLVEDRLGRSLSQQDILDRIRESGLSREEAKRRLGALGYDPAVVDAYYDALEAQGPLPGLQTGAADRFARALESLNRAPRVDLMAVDTVLEPDTAAEPTEAAGEEESLPLFGRALFARSTTEFQPILYGPVDEGYRLGPGDEVLLFLSGGVESAYSLEVTRQGYLIVPEVGQIPVGGLTMAQLDDVLRRSLARVYSGVEGPDPSIQLQASLGRLRTKQVFLVGEVERPGAYQVSAVSTVFNALYRSGGPKRSGSFRRVQVWRGDRIAGEIDLYDYLISGDSRGDLRLENGDRVHVPLSGPRVRIRGAVARPAIYELLPGEDLGALLRYAGGMNPDAVVRRVQIDRILPPDARVPGRDRVLVDVDLASLLDAGGEPVPLKDGDVVEVFAVSGDRRHRVALSGEVRRPGTYEWRAGMTLFDLLDRADGVGETAYTARAHVYRLDERTGDRALLPVTLQAGPGGTVGSPIRLADRDSVVVFSFEELKTPRLVHIAGYVKDPGTYVLADGMSIEDLILTAGGFVDGAHTASAEVARPSRETLDGDTTARVLNVPLAVPDPVTRGTGPGTLDGAPVGVPGREAQISSWTPDASDFRLRHGDRVFVRKAPTYEEPRTIAVTGEVMFPGEYVLSERDERLTQVLQRAGGLTAEGYVPGIRIVREGSLVAVNAQQALSDPGGPLNLVLEAGDSLQVPRYDPTVLVQGAVSFESRVLYEPGASLDYYVQRAGGYLEIADRDRVTVTHQNGERSSVNNVLLMFRRPPQVTPGSTINVPAIPAPERLGFNWDAFLTRSVSVVSVTATLLLAIAQLQR